MSGKRLTRNDEHRFLRITFLQNLCQIRSIDVTDEMSLDLIRRVMFQSFRNHDWTEIGTTDTDVHDGSDGFSSITFPFSGTNRVGEGFHVFQNGLNFIRSFFLDTERSSILENVSQSDVQNSSSFGSVDMFTFEHLIPEFFDFCFTSELKQVGQDFIVDQIFGVIEKDQIGGRGRWGGVCFGKGGES